ncbi:MAG: hypothetical protein AMXMBFR7_08190 [Planctomycetota bacterium]
MPNKSVRILSALLCLTFSLVHAATDSGLLAEAAAKFPANQWVSLPPPAVVIPKPWEGGRIVHINSFGSDVFCPGINKILTLTGYTTMPPGKAVPNNYSDSLYSYDCMRNELELVKRSNWRAGARSTDPNQCSYPLDENKTDPTPCPRHTYNGICYDAASGSFFLINGANAGVPNKHPLFDANQGTTVFTFWSFDIKSKRWTQLEYPALKRQEPYDTILRAVPEAGALYHFGVWTVSKYDLKAKAWKVLLDSPGGGPVDAKANAANGYTGGQAAVDGKRQRILFHGGSAWRPKKDGPAELPMHTVLVFNAKTEKFERLGAGSVEGIPRMGLVYVEHLDRYWLRTDTGEYLMDPDSGTWTKLKHVPFSFSGDRSTEWNYACYDSARGLILLSRCSREWAVLRLDATALVAAP